jgi:abequosyltransferase
MDNPVPQLSICIPTFNRAPFLRECLDSVLLSARGYEDQVEIVISDNASTDETRTVVAEFQNRYQFILYHCNSENTLDKNFYIVSTLATSQHVWLLGDDDRVTPNAIPTVLRQIQGGFDLIVSNYSIWSKDWSVIKLPSNLPIKTDCVFDDPNELLKRFGIHLGYISAVIIRRNLLFQPSYSEYEPYAAYGLGFLYAVYSGVASHCHARYLATPIVCNRADNAPISPELWERNYIHGSQLVFNALLMKGYTPSAIYVAQDRFLRDFVLRTILSRVRDGVNTRMLFKQLLPFYKRHWYFWGVCAPAMIIPRFSLQAATWLIRRFRPSMRKTYA